MPNNCGKMLKTSLKEPGSNNTERMNQNHSHIFETQTQTDWIPINMMPNKLEANKLMEHLQRPVTHGLLQTNYSNACIEDANQTNQPPTRRPITNITLM